MRLFVLFGVFCASLLGSQGVAIGQERSAEIELLRKEIELLKRENDLLQRENELLKKEVASLREGSGSPGEAIGKTGAVAPVTLDGVEYVYQGMTRNGATAIVSILATSKRGDRLGPNGQITLIDDDGEKYMGMPSGGFGLRPALREGVPVKLTWRFAPNLITGKPSAPSPTIKRFRLLTIAPDAGGLGDAVEFRDVPTEVSKSSGK